MTDSLIAKLESAAEGSRELDEAIAIAVLADFEVDRLVGMSDDDPGILTFRYPDGSRGTALRYTTSLDAALSLVPEGWEWCLTWEGGIASVDIGDPMLRMEYAAATPALAMCAAALKARSQS